MAQGRLPTENSAFSLAKSYPDEPECDIMIACVDTHYFDDVSLTAVLLFAQWKDELPHRETIIRRQQVVADYIPGRFFLRELPCILDAIIQFQSGIHTIVIDGYVQLGIGRAGLGQKLFEALNERIAVIGVAKNEFRGADNAQRVYRGGSRRPLFVTALGMNVEDAARSIEMMYGIHRIPSLLKRADYLSRHGLTGIADR